MQGGRCILEKGSVLNGIMNSGLILQLIIQFSSFSGLLISLYFLAVYAGLIKGNKSLIPSEICSENSCVSVLQTPFSRVFKVPNFYLGIFYYLIILGGSIFGAVNQFHAMFLLVSWLVVGFSVYLAYALIFRLKTNCVLCFVSHVINLVIALRISAG